MRSLRRNVILAFCGSVFAPLAFAQDAWSDPLLARRVVCYSADRPPTLDYMLEVESLLPPAPEYYLDTRWSGTAGDSIVLTWSLVPDGITISGAAGEASSPSELFARMDAAFATQGGRATWIARIQASFDRWQEASGVRFQRVAAAGVDWDDGAGWGTSGNDVTRGDVRVSMHPIDVANNILAYAFYPEFGDIVLDSAETWSWPANLHRFLRNVVMHEIGHAVGIGHVCSNNSAQLMEPFLSTNFDGVRQDDFRGAQHFYGDAWEPDNSAATANDLSDFTQGTQWTLGPPAPPPTGVNDSALSQLSLDAAGEEDWFWFFVHYPATSATIAVSVTPMGSTYDDTQQTSSNLNCTQANHSTNSKAVADLNLQVIGIDGTTVLATSASNGAGVAESLNQVNLPSAGIYFMRVYAGSSTGETQLYELTWTVSPVCPDSDGDGVDDCADGCPGDPNKTSPGPCGCGFVEFDTDGDGAPDCVDGCPSDPNKTDPGQCGCGALDTDSDTDGVADCVDNCASIANALQADCDTDGVGDACEIAVGTQIDLDANDVPDTCEGNPIWRASVANDGSQAIWPSYWPEISADGRSVAFASADPYLVSGDTNQTTDIFVRDWLSNSTSRVSIATGGTQANHWSSVSSLSANGRCVAFESQASNLVPSDTNGLIDVFVHERDTGVTTRVSVSSGGAQANGSIPWRPALSPDGRYVAYQSDATNLVAGDTNGVTDVFVHDRTSGQTTCISVSAMGLQGNGMSAGWVGWSADGARVSFNSDATNLVAADTNAAMDVFVRNMQSGAVSLVSLNSTGAQGNGGSFGTSMSADGRFVSFTSWANNLVAGDTNFVYDVFVRDTQNGTTARVSVDSNGVQGNLSSDTARISADGRWVVFRSQAVGLALNDDNGAPDVFVRDTLLSKTKLVSRSAAGVVGNLYSSIGTISSTGRFIAFDSSATTLVPGDTNGSDDVFVSDQATPSDFALYCTAKVNSLGCTPSLWIAGTPSASNPSPFVVHANQVRNNKSGLLIYGVTGPSSAPFHGGTLCIGAPVLRSLPVSSGGNPAPANDCSGVYSLDVNAFAAGTAGGAPSPALSVAGTKVCCQWWGRDPGFTAPNNITLSNALHYTVGP